MSQVDNLSREDLSSLPCRAATALAARCARRVQPLLQAAREHGGEELVLEVARAALAVAEDVARGGHEVRAAFPAAEASRLCAELSEEHCRPALASAAQAALAAYSIFAGAPSSVEEHVALVAEEAARALTGADRELLLRTQDRDARLLRVLAEQEDWNDETPVPPELLGPLWPLGCPEGWQADSLAGDPPRVGLYLEAPSSADEEEMVEAIRQMAHLVDELHRANGGQGLTLESVRICEESALDRCRHRLTVELVGSAEESAALLESTRLLGLGAEGLLREHWLSEDPETQQDRIQQTEHEESSRAARLAARAFLSHKARTLQAEVATLRGQDRPFPETLLEARRQLWSWVEDRARAGWQAYLVARPMEAAPRDPSLIRA